MFNYISKIIYEISHFIDKLYYVASLEEKEDNFNKEMK